MACCSGCRSCCALTRKNATLKLRTPISSAIELLLPLLFVVGMVLLSTLFSTNTFPAASYTNSGIGGFAPRVAAALAASPAAAAALPPAALALLRAPGVVLPVGALPAQLARQKWRLAVLPGSAGAVAAAAVADFFAYTCAAYPAFSGAAAFTDPFLRQLAVPSLCNATTVEFANEAALAAAIRDGLYLADENHPRIWAAIVFNAGAPSWDYSIRMNLTDVPDTSLVVNTFSTTYAPLTAAQYVSGAGGTGALPGFLTLQLLVDRFILGQRSVAPAAVDAARLLTRLGLALAPITRPENLTQLFTELNDPNPAKQAQLLAAARAWLGAELMMPQQVDLVPFPTPTYSTNVFFSNVLGTLTLLFVVAYVYPVSQLIRGLVLEKEFRLRESLKQMGATDGMLWGSWFAIYAAGYFVLSILVAVAGLRVFPASNKVLIFFLFFLSSLAATAWCFLVSVFFTKARTAAVLGSIIWVAAYFPFFSITSATPAFVKTASSLLAPTALGCAIDVVAALETSGLGVNPDTALNQVINNWTFISSIGMLILDTLLYLALAWYLDAVLPSWAREYGVPRPWYFPVSPAYWGEACGCARGAAGAPVVPPRATARRVSDWGGVASTVRSIFGFASGGGGAAASAADDHTPLAAPDARFVQSPDAEELAKLAAGRCVHVTGLHKEFPTPDSIKVAVNNVDLSFYEGQITCLLGHNGAGKTTVISMLTGVIPPTAGVANVFGRDMFAEQEAVRRDLGVWCVAPRAARARRGQA